MRMVLALMATLAASSALAQNKEPIALRDMGSFHIGGRLIEVTGQPIKEVLFTPGGVPAKIDPNGVYQVEQMYAQYFLVQNREGQAAAADVARRRAHRRHLRDQARRQSGLAQLFPAPGLGHLHLRRDGARPLRLDRQVQGRSGVPAARRSVGALPRRADRLMERRQGEARDLSGRAVSARRLRAVHEAGRAALGHDRRRRSSPPISSWSTRCAPASCWCTARPARSASRSRRRGPTR